MLLKKKMVARKTSKKTGYQNHFYLSVVSYIKQYNKLPDLHISKQRRNYYIKRLKLDDIIHREGYAFWVVDWDRWEQLRFIEQVKKQGSDAKNIRGHGFHFRVAIPELKNWHNRERYLIKKEIFYKESKATWKGYRLIVFGYKVWLCDESLVIYAPKDKSFYHFSAQESKINALNELFAVLARVESLLNVDLKFKNKYMWKVSKQHYGKIKDSMAKLVNTESSKIVVRYKNEEWLLFDRSLKVDEQETIHPQTADSDMDNIVVPFYNNLKDHYVKTGECMTFGKVLEVMTGLSKTIELQQQQINGVISKEIGTEMLKEKPSYIG